MAGTTRISLTIASDILDDVDYLCNKLSVTRSSLISEFLRPTVGDVRSIVDFALPADSDGDGVKARNPEQLRKFLHDMLSSRLSDMDSDLDSLGTGKHEQH